jgi:hypothetical protein
MEMKILLLNPHAEASQKLTATLQLRGAVVLAPQNAIEALQMLKLHGTSVDIAVVHREDAAGNGEPGLDFLKKVKADPQQADLPVVLTSAKWKDAQFSEHQKSPLGANAYLTWPALDDQVVQMIEAVLGRGIGSSAPAGAERTGVPAVGVTGTLNITPPPPPPGATRFTPKITTEESPTGIGLPSLMPALEATGGGEPPSLPTAGGLELAPPPLPNPDSAEVVLSQPEPASALALPASPEPGGITLQMEVGPSEVQSAGGIALTPASDAPPAALAPEPPTSIHLNIEELALGAEPAAAEPGQEDPPPLTPRFREDGGGPAATFATSATSEVQIPEEELAAELPYLFRRKEEEGERASAAAGAPALVSAAVPSFAQVPVAVGDAIVPGGAAQSPDTETLKKYLLLREQDVAALSAQLKNARDQIESLEGSVRAERARGAELSHVVEEQNRRIDDFEKDKGLAVASCHEEINELKFAMKAKVDKARLLETKVRDAAQEMEKLKERVRLDIRKIRVREKELENKLEIMKKDAEALIGARENKIVELKRKLDTLEFNMDLLQDRFQRERETSAKLRDRLAKAFQAVRAAGGLLDTGVNPSDSGEDGAGVAEPAPGGAASGKKAG